VVTIHDVEPATWERCARLRDWLLDHDVRCATLLVIPASDLHPFDRRSPAMRAWLEERIDAGDEVAQHGLHHRRSRTRGSLAGRIAAGRTDRREFVGLDPGETVRAVDAGARILRDAGIAADGFVAPGFAYTPVLRESLRARFGWWATADGVQGTAAAEPVRAPALALGAAGSLARVASPAGLRTAALVARGAPVRLELHPADLDHPRRIAAGEVVLRRHAHRRALTCGALVAAGRWDGTAAHGAGATPDQRLSGGA
jgi:predicted deacetylase